MTSWSFLTGHHRPLLRTARHGRAAARHPGVAGYGQQDPGVAVSSGQFSTHVRLTILESYC